MKKKAIINKYSPHKGQKALHRAIKANNKRIAVISSIRSGKTFALLHEILMCAWNSEYKGVDGFGVLVCAPTYQMLSTLLEKPISQLANDWGILEKSNLSTHELRLRNGNIIYFRSLDNYDNAVRGLNVSHIFVDEAALISEEAYDVLLTRAVTVNAPVILITTPRGRNNWFYRRIAAPDSKEGFVVLKFSIYDNPLIDEASIELLRTSYDELMFRQEIEGEFVNLTENLVYYCFSEKNLVDSVDESQLESMTFIGLDYNLNKNPLLFIRKVRGHNKYIVTKEVYGLQSTYDVAIYIKQHNPPLNNHYIIYDDSMSGNARQQSSATTNRMMLNSQGVYNIHTSKSNPVRVDRYARVNALLKNAKGECNLLIHKDCKHLIKDLSELTYKKGSTELDTQGEVLSHASDALGYVLYNIAPSLQDTRQLSFTEEFHKRAAAQQYI